MEYRHNYNVGISDCGDRERNLDRDKTFPFGFPSWNVKIKKRLKEIKKLMFTRRAMYVCFSKLHGCTINLTLPAEGNLSALPYSLHLHRSCRAKKPLRPSVFDLFFLFLLSHGQYSYKYLLLVDFSSDSCWAFWVTGSYLTTPGIWRSYWHHAIILIKPLF